MEQDLLTHEKFMEAALELARKAYDAGQFPVGCVIVQDGGIIASGGRSGTAGEHALFSEIDHAEIRALKSLESFSGTFRPDRAIIYSTMEPCLMCYGAILNTGIKTLVWGYEDVMGGATRVDRSVLPPLYRSTGIRIFQHVLRQKSLDLFYNFFNKEANLYWSNSLLETYTLAQGPNTSGK